MGTGTGTGGEARVGRTPASSNSLALFTDPLRSGPVEGFGLDPPLPGGFELIDSGVLGSSR
jgi:hypothetical protein